MKVFLPDIVEKNGSLNLSSLPIGCNTRFISVTGQDGSGKTNLRDGLAKYFSERENVVITAKSPCDAYLVKLLNNAISQNGYEDWYTEQMLFSFADGLLSNYMVQLNGHCDYFICQRGPIDQYAHGVTRSRKSYQTIYQIQKPERLAKFDVYIHMNCEAKVAIPPTLESRALSFWVKNEMKDEFVKRFNKEFEKEFWLMSKDEFLNKYKMLGTGEKHKKIDDFIGNFVALSVGSSIIRIETFLAEGKPVKKSTHCGLTKDEMEVPVIVLK